MSYREKEKIEQPKAEVAEVAALPVVRDTKAVFSDGLCNVCMQAMADHPVGPSGKQEDCNGWPMTFLDEKQSVVIEHERKAKEAKEKKDV